MKNYVHGYYISIPENQIEIYSKSELCRDQQGAAH